MHLSLYVCMYVCIYIHVCVYLYICVFFFYCWRGSCRHVACSMYWSRYIYIFTGAQASVYSNVDWLTRSHAIFALFAPGHKVSFSLFVYFVRSITRVKTEFQKKKNRGSDEERERRERYFWPSWQERKKERKKAWGTSVCIRVHPLFLSPPLSALLCSLWRSRVYVCMYVCLLASFFFNFPCLHKNTGVK